MKRLYLVCILWLFLAFAGCGGDECAKVIDLTDDEIAAGDASSSSISSSSSIFSGQSLLGSSKTIRGFAQKGTPVEPPSVRLVFLDELTLERKGKAYTGSLEGDFGEYSIQVDSIESRYVMVSVAGKCTSNVHVATAMDDIIMNVVADIGALDVINVNLFTHLETERVRELVRNRRLSFDDAKKQSLKEMLDMFHVNGDEREFGSPETWSFFGNGTGDLFLMAGSLLLYGMLGDFSAPLFESLLEDFALDGKWNNDSAMYQMAKSSFRNNLSWKDDHFFYPAFDGSDIESWRRKFDSTSTVFVNPSVVSDIDSMYTVFWENEFGLGACNWDNLGEIKKTRYDEAYICKSSDCNSRNIRYNYCNSSVRWMEATKMESDIYGIECSKTDYFMTSENPDTIPYVCESGNWRYALDVEKEFGLCTSELNGEFRETDKFGYTCKSKSWNVFVDSLVDARDGKTYSYRRFAHLFWMIDDLMDTTFTWDQADQCPEGWRLPTAAEWDSLLQQMHGWGENGLLMNLIVVESTIPKSWWSSTEENDGLAVSADATNMSSHPETFGTFTYGTMKSAKNQTYYVRCVKD